jgi:hypothetical protein
MSERNGDGLPVRAALLSYRDKAERRRDRHRLAIEAAVSSTLARAGAEQEAAEVSTSD